MEPWNGTEVQVGGFDYEFVNNGDGTVTYRIHNELTKESFFYHVYDVPVWGGALRVVAPQFGDKKRGGLLPIMGNLVQEFEWTELNP